MPFRLIDITVGDEKIQARPYEFNASSEEHDGTGRLKNSEYMVPTKFVTTCPKCVQLLEFTPNDIYIVEGGKKLCVDCHCGAKAAGIRVNDIARVLYALRSIDAHVHNFMSVANQASLAACSSPVVWTQPMQLVQFADPIESGALVLPGLARLDV